MVKIENNKKIIAKLISMVLLCLLALYPLFMRVDYTSVDFSVHSQIHWFTPLPLAYLLVIQITLISGLFMLHNKTIKILPLIFSYILVSGFVITQLPYVIQGDNLLHSANAKLINIYGCSLTFPNTYVYQFPSFFVLSSILSQLLGIEIIYLNTLLVAWLHIIVVIMLYVFLKSILNRENKALAPLICSFNLLGNFHLTYFLSLYTPRLYALPLFYLFLYTAFKQGSKIKIIGVLLLGAIITGHPVTPLYIILFIMGLLAYAIFQGVYKNCKHMYIGVGSLILILVSWIIWVIYAGNYSFEWIVKTIFGGVESPWHAAYGISSSFISEQLDFSKDFTTSLLRAYRLALIVFPYLTGGVVGGLHVLRTILNKEGCPDLCKAPLSFAAFSMLACSLLFFVIFGRGHDYFLLFSYPIFLTLAFKALATINCSSSRLRRFKVYGYNLLTIVLIIMLPLSFISVHSTRIYLGSSDYSGLIFLADFGRDKEISTTGDIFYDYAYFNPSYFWPGKTGRTLLIYTTPEALMEQAKKIPYVFQGDVAIRSFKQTVGLYFTGLPPDFLIKVDGSLAQSRDRIFDNSYLTIWSQKY